MKHALKVALIAIPLSMSLTGCLIISTEDDTRAEWLESSSKEQWQSLQDENKRKITELTVGDSFDKTRTKMGAPNFTEAFDSDGKAYQVLFYRTHHKHSDGTTTKDECTPLIFVDGTLTSWGDKAYDKL